MPLKFTSKEKRDELAERLATLAMDMLQTRSQGHDGRIGVTDMMMDDIRTAACVVGLADIQSPAGERGDNG